MRMIEELQFLRVDEMVPLVGNPNSCSAQVMDQLKASLLDHGLLEPFVLQAGTNIVVGGNHRLLALCELIAEGQLPADTTFPAGVFAFTEEQLKRASVALNKIAGVIGAAALRDFLLDVPFDTEAELEATGLSPEELDLLLSNPWEDSDIFDRGYAVATKRQSAPPPGPPITPAPPPPAPVVSCPECGHVFELT